jgi:hypothetical protein
MLSLVVLVGSGLLLHFSPPDQFQAILGFAGPLCGSVIMYWFSKQIQSSDRSFLKGE